MVERLDRTALTRMLEDLSHADLGDPRRIARAQAVFARLAAMPGASLPDAMVTDAELEGAYRLFNNEHVSFDQLLEPHLDGTAARANKSKLVLAIHDTTFCMFRHADPREVGYLSTGKPGFPLHMTLVVDTEEWRRPLGLTHAEINPRSAPPRKQGIKRKESGVKTGRKPDNEFQRWFRGIEATERRLHQTSVIHVADREVDSYRLIASCIAAGQRFVFRARTNRNVVADGEVISIRDLVDGAEAIFERDVPLSRRLSTTMRKSQKVHPPRESRVARLGFTATKATIQRPRIVTAEVAKTIEVSVLHVFEIDAPEGQEPVDWLLYTSESLDTKKQIEAVVDYYRCRWQIEELNKALKTGCVVQERQLESLDALTTMLALSLPIAVELLALRALARAEEKAPATRLMSDSQLAALRHLSTHRPLSKRPTVQDVLWCIAGLGGHIKNNGPAGWQVLQRGMEKFVSFAAGWCAREEADF